ncbi:NAD(P)/FAD-dependent oxidoreductase [Paenibacillus sp. IHBB 10380]|uniref:NAD(P)/FAD-dependent oxidoreductase n=1 Tax=Paenibacillus sp. IHBB 10380 TaxID=1566358 RepID=UPI0005CFB6E0|nr:FAD-dependent oxidoreductase [Paenibacillus sp. IHBB 10380]AJS59676.1 amino acid oxidase [Paenibacillus sp. IHBB 10380]
MHLNIGSLAWSTTMQELPQYPVLDHDITCDCLVIGGGIAGALVSYLLSLQQVNTVLVDKRDIGKGTTAANAGLLQFANDKSLTSFMHSFGEEVGVSYYKMCREALNKLRAIQDKLIFETQFIPRSSFYFASSEEDITILKEEYMNLMKHGFDVEYWNEQRIVSSFPFSKHAALCTHGDAEVNAIQLCQALVASAHKQGVPVFVNSEINSYEYKQDGVICHTNNHQIYAKKVVFALGYETQEFKPDANAYLNTTYAIVTNPVVDLSEWHERCLIWETARPYLYMRTTPEGRIVAGGLDEVVIDPEDREVRLIHQSQKLLHEVKSLFPNFGPLTIDYSWASIFGSTHDGLPMIGPHPRYPHCYFIEGYGGNGTITSMIAADLLADVISGNPRPEMELFSLTRTTKPLPNR